MKRKSSIRSARNRKGCIVVRRKTASGRRKILVISKSNPRCKVTQG